ncbi:hypothetical protein [Paracidovorax avenae]|uniref:hypothetical protein n=1 Tax=Paracidovorax avenae TaxID=80867 RepID=UPI001AD8449C|nr:hypothetical protein [Paracidovorax avenae]
MFLPMNPAVQGGMAEGAVLTGAGGMPAMGAGAGAGTMDPDFPGGGRRPGTRGAAAAAAAAALASGIKSAANVATQVYRDNQDKDQKCKTFPYSQRATECKGGKAHHMVPDRAWRSPGTRGKWTNIPPIDDAINNARESIPVVGQLYKGGYYYTKMDEGSGLCICLSDKDHSDVHDIYDEEEETLGKGKDPQYVVNLVELERLAAEKISEITGCSEGQLFQDMKNHHDKLGLGDDTLVRADPRGKSGLSIEEMGKRVSSQKPGKISF